MVDYLTAKQIREPELKVTHKNLERFITEFGYRIDEVADLKVVTV